MKSKKNISIADLFPDLSSKQIAEAEFNLLGYLDLVRRIFERIVNEDPGLLTKIENSANLKEKKDKTAF